jgi:uncharacterized protein Yka (UPF0111/DUF47 family)
VAAAELAGLIVLQAEELAQGVSLLEKNNGVLEHCDEVNRLEDEADDVSVRRSPFSLTAKKIRSSSSK